MKMEITERDRKLLVRLSLFVIVVVIGYWGILPFTKAIKEDSEKILEQQELKESNDKKIAMIPMMEEDNAELEAQIVKDKEYYYPIMGGDEIDKYFTTMALKHNLYAYDLKIVMPQNYTTLEPYQYSAKALSLVEEDEEIPEDEKPYYQRLDEEMNQAYGKNPSSVTIEDVETGISAVEITMRLGGSRENLQSLLEDLFKNEQRLRVSRYSWIEDRVLITDAEGALEFQNQMGLDLTVEIYVCEE